MISYKEDYSTVINKSNHNTDGFSRILKETQEFFQENHIDIISGYSEILNETSLFDEYLAKLTRGLDADESSQITDLLRNQRSVTLQEATVSQISPISGLAMPTVRKMWSKTSLKNIVPTEVAKKPEFSISWMNPYIRRMNGERHDLPNSIRTFNDLNEQPKVYAERIDVPTSKGANLFDLTIENGGKEAAIVNRDAINPKIKIYSVFMEVPTDSGTTEVEVLVNKERNVSETYNFQVETMSMESDPTKRTKVTDQVIGNLNCETGDFNVFSATGAVKGFKFFGTLTHENNRNTDSVSFEIKKKDISIGTGAHLTAPLPIEFLQDTLALYNIDATVESVDLMSQVTAQKLDLKLIQFFEDDFKATGEAYVGVFDVKPSAGFAGSPTEWKKEIRSTINWWADKLKSDALFNEGYFAIFGNPLDINLLPDINWQFQAVTANGEQGTRGGVNINYNFGVMTFNNVFQVLSSDNVPQGELVMFFIPTTNKYMTYKYFPYSFNVEKGNYISDQDPNVPSIMLTKRDTVESLISMQVRIKILNNDGRLISSYALGGMAQ